MVVIEIRCDKCGSRGISTSSTYAHQLRQGLKEDGWKVAQPGGKDFCPKCKPRRKRRPRFSTYVEVVNSQRTDKGVNR